MALESRICGADWNTGGRSGIETYLQTNTSSVCCFKTHSTSARNTVRTHTPDVRLKSSRRCRWCPCAGQMPAGSS